MNRLVSLFLQIASTRKQFNQVLCFRAVADAALAVAEEVREQVTTKVMDEADDAQSHGKLQRLQQRVAERSAGDFVM